MTKGQVLGRKVSPLGSKKELSLSGGECKSHFLLWSFVVE